MAKANQTVNIIKQNFPLPAKLPVVSRKRLVIIALGLLAALFIWLNKSWLIAGWVNGQPTFRFQLEDRMVKRYASTTLDEMISEQIVRQEAAKRGIKVTSQEVSGKIAEIEKSLSGKVSLSEALTQQGMTMADFQNQVELQIMVEKLTVDQTKVTDQEVADYITNNKATLVATQEADMKLEATKALVSQKTSTAFQKLFSDLKAQAKVVRYL